MTAREVGFRALVRAAITTTAGLQSVDVADREAGVWKLLPTGRHASFYDVWGGRGKPGGPGWPGG